jgi:hypothetical protein
MFRGQPGNPSNIAEEERRGDGGAIDSNWKKPDGKKPRCKRGSKRQMLPLLPFQPSVPG